MMSRHEPPRCSVAQAVTERSLALYGSARQLRNQAGCLCFICRIPLADAAVLSKNFLSLLPLLPSVQFSLLQFSLFPSVQVLIVPCVLFSDLSSGRSSVIMTESWQPKLPRLDLPILRTPLARRIWI